MDAVMKAQNMVRTLQDLNRLAILKRCVVNPYTKRPMPAAFVLSMPARSVLSMIEMGMPEYKPGSLVRKHSDAPWKEGQHTHSNGETCEFCKKPDGTDLCGDMRNGYICTRPAGHTGEHVACGGLNLHMLRAWDNE